MKFCNKHIGVVSYVTTLKRKIHEESGMMITMKHSFCPLCEKIYERKVFVEKLPKIDEDMIYFQQRLFSALKIPKEYLESL